jgi:hypothetical protein
MGKDLAGFQKPLPLFGTLTIIPHPHPQAQFSSTVSLNLRWHQQNRALNLQIAKYIYQQLYFDFEAKFSVVDSLAHLLSISY